MRVTCRSSNFGLDVATDELNNRAFETGIRNKSSASKLFSTPRATNHRIRGAYIVKIDGKPVFTKAEVVAELRRMFDEQVKSFEIVFAPEKKLSAGQVRNAVKEHNLFAPTVPPDTAHVHSLSVSDVRSIAAIRFPDTDFSPPNLPHHHAALAINAIRSKATTDEEQALDQFTHRTLKGTSMLECRMDRIGQSAQVELIKVEVELGIHGGSLTQFTYKDQGYKDIGDVIFGQ